MCTTTFRVHTSTCKAICKTFSKTPCTGVQGNFDSPRYIRLFMITLGYILILYYYYII